MITVGGGSASTPALSRAIREMGEQARKQLDETGSLAGFESKVTDDSSGQGSVTVTVSALAMAAYDASAGKDDTFLAFTLSQALPDGTADGISSGSSSTIRSDQDIDAFVTNLANVAKRQTFTSFLYGTPEEIASVYPEAPEAATAAGGAAADSTTASGGPSQLFSKLKDQQTASNQLIDLLQSFVDGLGGKSRRDGARSSSDAASPGQGEKNAIQTRLAQFTGTDIST